MLGCRPTDTPIKLNHKLDGDKEDVPMDGERYQWLVGKLIYLSHTRPDKAYAVSVASLFMHNPKEIHIEAVFRILCYLKATPSKGIQFQKAEGIRVEAYTNADWAGSITDRRSTSGHCTFLGDNLEE
ncbi:putative mitochondrial protein [Vitis vinifera]|uniref:Putative mitochondrial protein n=1 Tax=Vitis vinifera TaxID=29760 RepID=A0A438D2K0_VITVI|nr:putative mitochondrial protein [Vitis vinifera]